MTGKEKLARKRLEQYTTKAGGSWAHFKAVEKDNGVEAYSEKEETRVEGPWHFGTPPPKIFKEKLRMGNIMDITEE